MSIENYGSYQLLKRLATGGMAQIYLARRKGPDAGDTLLVVKRILPHLAENSDFVRMFLDEARIAARLNHPNIVQVNDLGAQDDSFFIAMEYIHGEDVRRVWRRSVEADKPLPVPLACRIILEAAAGLDYAHKKTDAAGKPLGIVHRDISPQNILVTFEGGVKVVDFGIAKAADQATVTRSGVLKGKYSYMSPEQAAGQRVDCRSDVFALGVVLYELLTGVRLFKRHSDMQTLKAVTECQITPPSELGGERVPRSLDAIVMKALAKDPDTRYAEAAGLQLALEEWLGAHRQPSSQAHLSSFMKEIFAGRLAEEARLGEVMPPPESPPQATGQRPALETPSRRTGAQPSLSRPPTPPPQPPTTPPPARAPRGPETRQERRTGVTGAVRRGSKSSHSQLVTEPSPLVTQPMEFEESGAARWWIAGITAVVSALVVGGGMWMWLRPSAPATPPGQATPVAAAQVRVVTEPPGATVVFNGAALAEVTPLTLPPVPAGRYSLVVALDGYREQQLMVDIPASGVVALEPRKLVRLTPPPPEPPAAPAQVRLTLEAEPAQATLTVDGVARGKPPVVVEAEPGRELEVRVEAAKHQPVTRKVRLGQAPTQAERFVLEPLPPPVAQTPPPEPKVEPKQEPRPAPEAKKALVRFTVSPITDWAEVTCGGRFLGTTPFADVPLPVGVYECRFHNPERGRTKTQRVEVKASGQNTVVVKF